MEPVDLDARGLICPLPVLKLRKRFQGLAEGTKLTMLTDDPVAVIDIPHFCLEQGHEVVESREVDGARWFLLRRGPDPRPVADD